MTDNASGAWGGATFRKSSYSGPNAECVEVAWTDARFGLRDTKNVLCHVLAVAVDQGQAFLTAIKREHIAGP